MGFEINMDQLVRDKVIEHFRHLPTVTYKAGESILHADNDPKKVFFILEGTVESYDIDTSGKKIDLATLKPGFFFPMTWTLNSMPNPFFYYALTDVKVLQVNADEFKQFLLDNPDVLFNYTSRLMLGHNELKRKHFLTVSNQTTLSLAFELLIEAYYFGQFIDDKKVLSRIHIKQQILADRSGLARETVSRTLHRMQDRGLVNITKDGIIVNVPKFEELLEFSLKDGTYPRP